MGDYADYLRWLYRSGRPNRFAKLQNRATAAVYAAGIWPRRVAALDVRGRKSGRLISFPVVIANCDGERYLVSMLGQDVTTRSLPSCGVTWTWLLEHVRMSPSAAAPRGRRLSRSHPGCRSASLVAGASAPAPGSPYLALLVRDGDDRAVRMMDDVAAGRAQREP